MEFNIPVLLSVFFEQILSKLELFHIDDNEEVVQRFNVTDAFLIFMFVGSSLDEGRPLKLDKMLTGPLEPKPPETC